MGMVVPPESGSRRWTGRQFGIYWTEYNIFRSGRFSGPERTGAESGGQRTKCRAVFLPTPASFTARSVPDRLQADADPQSPAGDGPAPGRRVRQGCADVYGPVQRSGAGVRPVEDLGSRPGELAGRGDVVVRLSWRRAGSSALKRGTDARRGRDRHALGPRHLPGRLGPRPDAAGHARPPDLGAGTPGKRVENRSRPYVCPNQR